MNDKDPAAYDLLTYAWVFLLSLMGGMVALLLEKVIARVPLALV